MKHNVEAFKKYYINATKEEVIEDMFLDNCNLQQEIERLNNIIGEALGIANERFNYYSNHKNNNEEHLEDWGNIFNILLRRDNK